MKAIILLLATISIASMVVADTTLQCEHPTPEVPTEWIDMKSGCVRFMREQVKAELRAAMQYLAMGAYFSKDTVNRPGFAHMFFESASEERDHAIKLISYLLMRGELKSNVSSLINENLVAKTAEWTSGEEALKDALRLEAQVTEKIRNVIIKCENDEGFNDYHLVDYLTGVYLEEQYKGQREIAGRISTLSKFGEKHGALGEFLFDKKLLSGEV